MCVEFGEVTVIIGLVINFLAFRLIIVHISWHLNILIFYKIVANFGDSLDFSPILVTFLQKFLVIH